jgi:hypothetical protein
MELPFSAQGGFSHRAHFSPACLSIGRGCFGDAPPSAAGSWLSLGRDLALLVAAGWLYVRQCRIQTSS